MKITLETDSRIVCVETQAVEIGEIAESIRYALMAHGFSEHTVREYLDPEWGVELKPDEDDDIIAI
jgi:hypothetical protein